MNLIIVMDGSVWDCCPADINAVERKNPDSEDKKPQQLQSAMINLQKADKYIYCTKHIAAMDAISITLVAKDIKELLNQTIDQRSMRMIQMPFMVPLIIGVTLNN